MADREKIQGNALMELFKGLQMSAAPLELCLSDSDDLRWAYIAYISKPQKSLGLKVNSPGGLDRLSVETPPPRLRVEFADQDNDKYVFSTGTWKLSRDMIWIDLPKFVHRYHRRKLFRLEAPHGTRLFFNINDKRYKLLVINVSLSGSLGVLASLTEQMEQELKPYTSKLLKNAELLFPSKDRKKDGTVVSIKSCQIKRSERNPITNKFEVAIEFKEVSEAEQKNLTSLFYQCQREYLRRRKIMRL